MFATPARLLLAVVLLAMTIQCYTSRDHGNAPVVARGLRTCNLTSPVLYATGRTSVPSLTVLLSTACTKRVLDTILDNGVAGLLRLMKTSEGAGADGQGGTGGGGDAPSSSALAACSGVLGHIGSDPARHNEGHATVVTNKDHLVVKHEHGTADGAGGADSNSSTTDAGAEGHINASSSSSLGNDGFVKIIAATERVDEIQRLMACDFAGDLHFVGAGNTSTASSSSSSSSSSGGGGPAAKKERKKKRAKKKSKRTNNKKKRRHVEL